MAKQKFLFAIFVLVFIWAGRLHANPIVYPDPEIEKSFSYLAIGLSLFAEAMAILYFLRKRLASYLEFSFAWLLLTGMTFFAFYNALSVFVHTPFGVTSNLMVTIVLEAIVVLVEGVILYLASRKDRRIFKESLEFKTALAASLIGNITSIIVFMIVSKPLFLLSRETTLVKPVR